MVIPLVPLAPGTDIVTLECFCPLHEVDKPLASLIRLQGARLKDKLLVPYLLSYDAERVVHSD